MEDFFTSEGGREEEGSVKCSNLEKHLIENVYINLNQGLNLLIGFKLND